MANRSVNLDKQIWVIRLRYLVATVLAASYILSIPLEQIWNLSFSMLALAAIITIIVAANIVLTRFLKRPDVNLENIGFLQCALDLLVVSLIVHQHGASTLVGYLFVLVVLVAGVLLQRRGILLIAAIASVLYLLLLLLEHYGHSVPLPPILGGVGLLPKNAQFLIDVAMKVFFFYIIALAAANMQDMIARTNRENEFLAQFNQGIIDMVPMGIMVFDAGRNIVVFNPTMERTALVAPGAAMGKNVEEIFPGMNEAWGKALAQVEETGEEVRLLGAAMPLSGDRSVRVNARIQPLKLGEQILATVCLIQTGSR